MRTFVSAMTLKGINQDTFYIIFPWTFDEDVMKRYNVVNPGKVTNWEDLSKEFLNQNSYNTDLPITL